MYRYYDNTFDYLFDKAIDELERQEKEKEEKEREN